MRSSDLPELHYITPIENVPSIMAQGILSNRRARRLNPAALAMAEIQDMRANRSDPGGRALHDYANLYICARNPMMYKRRAEHLNCCVLCIRTEVIDLPEVVLADGNAASDYTRFLPSPEGLVRIDGDLVFAEYWTDDNPIVWYNKKRVKCAEVLVPDRVESNFIIGARVSCGDAQGSLENVGFNRPITIDSHLFFRA